MKLVAAALKAMELQAPMVEHMVVTKWFEVAASADEGNSSSELRRRRWYSCCC